MAAIFGQFPIQIFILIIIWLWRSQWGKTVGSCSKDKIASTDGDMVWSDDDCSIKFEVVKW